jgi:hypothetical protein
VIMVLTAGSTGDVEPFPQCQVGGASREVLPRQTT